jgi:hypothetical protein
MSLTFKSGGSKGFAPLPTLTFWNFFSKHLKIRHGIRKTAVNLLEIVFITTHVVHKMPGMALLVLTKYICHRLLHIGCPRNITEPIDIILQ